jgi:flagellar export protein FliJ
MAGFRLARVLRLRTQLRERARDDFGRARAALGAARERAAAVRATDDAASAAEAAAAAAGTTVDELLRFRRFSAATRARGAVLAAEVAELTGEVVRRRNALVARRREERQLEILREHARDRDEAAAERAAAVLLDELSMRRR